MKITVHDPLVPGEYELTAVVAPEPPPPDPALPWIGYRADPDDTPIPLDLERIADSVWISLENYTGPGPVVFKLNGVQHRVENNAPWDWNGSASWSTTGLADGHYLFSAEVGPLEVVAWATIDNVADVTDPEEPPPIVPPVILPPPTAATEIVEDGITWAFGYPVVVHRFVSGGAAVVGPVTVAYQTPDWDGSRNGAMVNPIRVSETSVERQGFDSKLARYGDTYRVRFPLVLSPGQSLLSLTSWRSGEPGAPTTSTATQPGVTRPTGKDAEVLTCLAEPPQPGDFRPPYAGTAKPRYSVSTMIDVATLPRMTVPANATSLSKVIERISRPRIVFREKYHVGYMAPSRNHQGYGREFSAELSDAMLYLLLDISDADKRTIAIHLAQHAIDQVGVFETGYINGRDGGGIMGGLRGMVVIGGHLLGAPEVRDYFQGKHIKLTQESAQITRDADGVYWREWDTGSRANPGKTSYRTCCTTNGYIGQILVARALGLISAYDHEPMWDYCDEYMSTPKTHAFHHSWISWHRELWWSTNGGRNL